MKRLLIALLFTVSLSGMAQQFDGDSWSEVRSKGSGTLACIYYPTPGLVYEENGQVKGVCVDILTDFKEFVQKKYGKTVNIKFVNKETNWTQFLNKVKSSNNALGVANVTITAERKRQMKFTPAFMSNPLIFLTHSSAPKINSAEQIGTQYSGYTPYVIEGSTHVPIMKNLQSKYFPDTELAYTNSGIETLQKLEANPKSFTILDFTEYFDAVRNRRPIDRQNIEVGGPQEDLGFIMPMSSDWQPIWEEFLTPAYKQSVAYKKIIASNLGNAFLSMIRQ